MTINGYLISDFISEIKSQHSLFVLPTFPRGSANQSVSEAPAN